MKSLHETQVKKLEIDKPDFSKKLYNIINQNKNDLYDVYKIITHGEKFKILFFSTLEGEDLPPKYEKRAGFIRVVSELDILSVTVFRGYKRHQPLRQTHRGWSPGKARGLLRRNNRGHPGRSVRKRPWHPRRRKS